MPKALVKAVKAAAAPPKKAARAKKYVYFFGAGKADGDRTMKDMLGGKGSGLAEMTNAGLPVPPGFTISTDVCNIYYAEKGKVPAEIDREIEANLREAREGRRQEARRRGEPAARLRALGREVLDARHDGHDPQPRAERRRRSRGSRPRPATAAFAFDSYRRFIQMFGNVVLGIPKEKFEHEFEAREARARRQDRHRPRRGRPAARS